MLSGGRVHPCMFTVVVAMPECGASVLRQPVSGNFGVGQLVAWEGAVTAWPWHQHPGPGVRWGWPTKGNLSSSPANVTQEHT